MFKINYTFQKGGPVYKCTYPDEKDCKHNLFVVRGKNDRGKSTSLQMVALGMGGLDLDDIDGLLKARMRRLVSTETEICEFNFTISDKDNKIKVEARLKDGKPTIKVNGAPRNPTYITDHFKIIFDTPKEPIKKLQAGLSTIKDDLSQYERHIKTYVDTIKAKLDEIETYEDKGKLTAEQKKQLKDRREAKLRIDERLSTLQKEFIKLKMAEFVFRYHRLQRDLLVKKSYIADLKKRSSDLKKLGAKGGTLKYRELRGCLTANIENLKLLANTYAQQLTALSKSISKVISDICKIVTFKDINDKKLKNWYAAFEYLQKQLESDPNYEKRLPEEDQLELLEKLIALLKEFTSISATIPGTAGKSVNEFLDLLESEAKKIRPKLAAKNKLKTGVDACSNLIASLGKLAETFALMPDNIAEDSQLDEIQALLDKAKNEERDITKNIIMAEDGYNKLSKEDISAAQRYDPSQISGEYNAARVEILDLESKSKNVAAQILAAEQYIQDLERAPKPSKTADKDKLKSTYSIAKTLLAKIGVWVDYLANLDLENPIRKEISEDKRTFYEALGDYFANSLKVVYFENRSWSLKQVDLLNLRYIVEKRKPIDFFDIGTGHTALNALLAILKQDCGDKKKILLFDEVGDMDEENINRLLAEIKMQIDAGKVLFALLSQADNSKPEVVMEPIY